MDYLISFLIGGVICALVQILLDRTKLMPGRVMVCLVCGGVILGFAGLYQPFQDFAKAGASVPLLGFGNVLWKGVKEAVDKKVNEPTETTADGVGKSVWRSCMRLRSQRRAGAPIS